MDVSVHIIVEGLVQGVGYRWYAARNLYDGTVEVHASGDRSLLEELIRDLKIGPRSAHVTDMKIEWDAPEKGPGSQFEIR
jgi:acylphosphatase